MANCSHWQSSVWGTATADEMTTSNVVDVMLCLGLMVVAYGVYERISFAESLKDAEGAYMHRQAGALGGTRQVRAGGGLVQADRCDRLWRWAA